MKEIKENLKVAFLTGGSSTITDYCLLLANSLTKVNIGVDVITENVSLPENHLNKRINIIPIRGSTSSERTFISKIIGILTYYYKLFKYITTTKIDIFHFQFYRFLFIEAVLFNSLVKILGKRLIYTVHNVWPHEQRGNWYYVILFSYIYRICDALICHNKESKDFLINDFGINPEKIYIIPLGILQVIPRVGLNKNAAKKIMIPKNYINHPILLFFGRIYPYKGIEYLIKACKILIDQGINIFLIIAGSPGNDIGYFNSIKLLVDRSLPPDFVYFHETYVPPEEVERYFRAADVVVLPYKEIYQSAVHILSLGYGTPVIATEIGSFKEDIIEGKTGYIVPIGNALALANAIKKFIKEMFPLSYSLEKSIQEDAWSRFSWDRIAEETKKVYIK